MSSAMQTVSQHTHTPSQYVSAPSSQSQSQSQSQPVSRSSRQHIDNAAAAAASSPVAPQQFYSPSSNLSPAMNSPRDMPLPPSTHGSPVTPTISQSGNNPSRSRGPPIPPPRTSSNNRSHSSSAAPSNTSSAERVGGSSRHKRRGESGREHRSDRERTHGASSHEKERAKDDTTPTTTRSRRRGPHSPEGPQRAASTREPRDRPLPGTMGSRSEAAMGPSSVPGTGGLVKEASAVLNRVVVTDPEVDIERAQARQAEAHQSPASSGGLGLVGSEGVDDGGRGGSRSRHDYSNSRRKETTFGDYILGQKIGEGEFGKVKLGWKKDGSVQVAIKLIRRESLGNHPNRLPKIYREISILRELSHPNIVRLHEMVETDRHIGIILEYASGGELFDYILHNRYLKDNAARRLFAQLVSGVGYLHKKGIVHRDLKLENLLLDRNRNIIITDFGFANTFNPADELGDEIEYNLTNREFVKRLRLDRGDAKGMKRGDLMQTSCGSPCYAAPELVVSDSLYTGRKVDVWSCGVILYAMLAGYLPFDDDPANPEGDNINLLYKYIVTTPLTFPEYVTPHARDLLRRILVPDPRKRADLFEVARHSWLTEYAHVMAHITSNTTNVSDIANTTVPPERQDGPSLTRSASVREPPKTSHQSNVSPVGGLAHQQGKISPDEEKPKTARDAKRRTVQVEYVAPQSQTARGDSSPAMAAPPVTAPRSSSKTRARSSSRDPAGLNPESSATAAAAAAAASRSKPLPKDPPVSLEPGANAFSAADRSQGNLSQTARPTTGGSMASNGNMFDGRLPSRGSYSQPAAPAVAATNVQGRLAQPKSNKYNISSPIPQQPGQTTAAEHGRRPSTQQTSGGYPGQAGPEVSSKGHKRSSTVTSIGEKLFGRTSSLLGGRNSIQNPSQPRSGKRYPPTSMKEPYLADEPRTSMDSRRSISHVFHRRSDVPTEARPRRFSLLPASFSMKAFSHTTREQPGTPTSDSQAAQMNDFLHSRKSQEHQRRLSTAPSSAPQQYGGQHQGAYDSPGPAVSQDEHEQAYGGKQDYSTQIEQQFAALHASPQGQYNLRDPRYPSSSQPVQDHHNNHQPNHAAQQQQPQQQHHPRSRSRSQQPVNYNEQFTPTSPNHAYQQQDSAAYNPAYPNNSRQSMQAGRVGAGGGSVLQKNHRRFADAYEYEKDPSHHSGSSGAARKVMDFFRRRGKARAGDER